jgi:hypothetical protein
LNQAHYNNFEVKSRQLLYVLIGTLVLEGVFRKLVPGGISIIIFFFKDLLCLTGVYYIASNKLTDGSKIIARKIKVLIILMYPLLCYNLFIDPILFVWGGKLYLLYTVIAILMPIAFPGDSKDKFIKFVGFILLLLSLAVFMGLFQLTLPPSHWLNRSVGGDSLEAFSAAGMLRISSTFSFTGQYSYFLVFSSAIYFCGSFLRSSLEASLFSNKWVMIIIGVLLVTGSFSTGGRSAVFGLFAIAALGFIFIILNNFAFAIKKFSVPLFLFLFIFPFLQALKPEYFAAYNDRTEGRGGTVTDNFARLTEPFSGIEDGSLFGNGLGVMTNGSDKVSAYAASIRYDGTWTESDFATIMWEGGFYLALIWYGFRLFLIFYSFRILLSIKESNYYSAASFLVAYITIIGITGTLTIQPPMAIYFWLCIGALICIQKFDEFNSNIIKNTFYENK